MVVGHARRRVLGDLRHGNARGYAAGVQVIGARRLVAVGLICIRAARVNLVDDRWRGCQLRNSEVLDGQRIATTG
jgi:hypothetical protein